jgi:hypothetical protein
VVGEDASPELRAEIDRLYALSLDEFTPARDELARRLRTEGDREAAAELKRLRKPNLPAWALNRVRQRDPQRVDELIEAGERLQEAQQQLVAGGERGLLRGAAADERRLVEEVVAVAERELAETGHPLTAALQSKLWATAHAGAVSPEPRELLRAGRLVRDYEVSDLGLMVGAGDGVASQPAPQSKPKPARPEAPRRARAGRGQADGERGGIGGAEERAQAEREAAKLEEAERKEAERQARGIRRALERARAQHEKLASRLADAQEHATEARREAARAATELERAEASVEQANARTREAAARVDELQAELDELGV